MEGLSCKGELLVCFVHCDVGAAGNAAGTHAAGNNGCVRGHTAADSENTLRSLHAGDVLRRGFKTDKNNLLALCFPCFCIVSGENNLTAGSAR